MEVDGRTIPRPALEYLRRASVQRVEEGERPSDVMRSLGLCRTTIYRWLRRYKEGGWKALYVRSPPGRSHRLASSSEQTLLSWIDGHDPRDYGFAEAMWTRAIVATLAWRAWSITVSASTIGRLLKKQGLSRQRPIQRSYRRNDEAVIQWRHHTFPELKCLAVEAKANIYFWDEAGLRTNDRAPSTWARRGRTPTVRTLPPRQSVNMASALNEAGAFWYATYTGKLSGAKFVELLDTFLSRRSGKVWLVLDNLPVHAAPEVDVYVAKQDGRLELHFLPPYAPELNPDEYVWNAVKSEHRKRPLQEGEKIKTRARHYLKSIQMRPAVVRSFFDAPDLEYINPEYRTHDSA